MRVFCGLGLTADKWWPCPLARSSPSRIRFPGIGTCPAWLSLPNLGVPTPRSIPCPCLDPCLGRCLCPCQPSDQARFGRLRKGWGWIKSWKDEKLTSLRSWAEFFEAKKFSIPTKRCQRLMRVVGWGPGSLGSVSVPPGTTPYLSGGHSSTGGCVSAGRLEAQSVRCRCWLDLWGGAEGLSMRCQEGQVFADEAGLTLFACLGPVLEAFQRTRLRHPPAKPGQNGPKRPKIARQPSLRGSLQGPGHHCLAPPPPHLPSRPHHAHRRNALHPHPQ